MDRVLRTGLVEKPESGSRIRGFTAAITNAAKFKKMSQMTRASMIPGGPATRHGPHLVAGTDGGQHPDVAQGRPGRRRPKPV